MVISEVIAEELTATYQAEVKCGEHSDVIIIRDRRGACRQARLLVAHGHMHCQCARWNPAVFQHFGIQHTYSLSDPDLVKKISGGLERYFALHRVFSRRTMDRFLYDLG